MAHTLRSAILIAACSASAWLPPVSGDLLAQGVTTAAVRGTVLAADGTDADGTRVTVRNMATGYVVEREVRHGRFLIQGLEVGGPYTITLQRLGFRPEQRERVYLTLGEPLELQFLMQPSAILLEPLHVTAPAPLPRAGAHGGTATTVPDSLLQRLPTLNRNLYDFVALAPQVSTKIGFAPGGMSGGGVGFRFNNFLIQGVPQRSLSGSQPREFAGGRTLPFEAVSEYQILLAPYDVRYGDFAGALVNAVTRSGTNRFRGSAFADARNDALARSGAADPFERWQYGFSLGGPIVRDRLHFFVAPELQRLTSPAPGPFVGQPAAATPPVPVTEADLARLEEVMEGYGLVAGSGGPVENRNPLGNAFARLDLALPEGKSRAVLWVNDVRSENLSFSRGFDVFPLSTHTATNKLRARTAAVQLLTDLPGAAGGQNELLVSHESGRFDASPGVHQPIVRVALPSTAGGAVTVVTGTPGPAQGGFFRSRQINVRDNLTLPLRASHVVTLGLEVERFELDRGGVPGSYGDWTFSSLDSLEAGVAERFEIRRDFGGAGVPIAGGQYAVYAGDQWQVGERVSLTLGLRADWLSIDDRAPFNAAVDSIFRRRTDEMPRGRVHLSPRLGFAWDPSGTGRDRLRGGLGVFTGRPPLAWYHSALSSYGVGIGTLRCGQRPTDSGLPPPFVPDLREAPTACATGPGLTTAPNGEVDLLDGRLRMAQTLRASLAYERRLPGDLLVTGEALITRNVSDFVFVNLNLEGPRAIDRHGRVLYGRIDPAGVAAPTLRSDFAEVIELRNTSKNHAYQLSTRLDKRFSDGAAAIASYTHSRVRDVQTPLRVNTPGRLNWESRAVSGRHDDLSPGISLNDVPHRIVAAGTYTAPWRRWSTLFSLYYVGEAGSPFTYRASGIAGRGDLNADGSNLNDPIYVPRDAFDPNEIIFTGRSDDPGADNSPAAQAEREMRQRAAFERFIEATPCLRRQRGRILERNGCREPWSHTTIASVRQAIPVAGGALELQLDVFNVLNLLNGDWGHVRVASADRVRSPGSAPLLEHVGQTPEPLGESQPIFRFDETATGWTTLPAESAFQLQFGVRYRF